MQTITYYILASTLITFNNRSLKILINAIFPHFLNKQPNACMLVQASSLIVYLHFLLMWTNITFLQRIAATVPSKLSFECGTYIFKTCADQICYTTVFYISKMNSFTSNKFIEQNFLPFQQFPRLDFNIRQYKANH